MTVFWRRDEVELDQLWEKDGAIYKVVALIDEPVAVLALADDNGAELDRPREHHVISSLNFSKFSRLDKIRPGSR